MDCTFTEEKKSLLVSIILAYWHQFHTITMLFIQRIYSQEWPITPPETPSPCSVDPNLYTRPDNEPSAKRNLNFTPTKVYMYTCMCMCGGGVCLLRSPLVGLDGQRCVLCGYVVSQPGLFILHL